MHMQVLLIEFEVKEEPGKGQSRLRTCLIYKLLMWYFPFCGPWTFCWHSYLYTKGIKTCDALVLALQLCTDYV